MTETEEFRLLNKVKKLLRQHNEAVISSVICKLYSGGIDTEKYDLTNYSLPKVLLTSALHDHKNDFEPFCRSYQEDVKNLNSF